jgi:ABC-type iron transport system FetAB ATPase subunit
VSTETHKLVSREIYQSQNFEKYDRKCGPESYRCRISYSFYHPMKATEIVSQKLIIPKISLSI